MRKIKQIKVGTIFKYEDSQLNFSYHVLVEKTKYNAWAIRLPGCIGKDVWVTVGRGTNWDLEDRVEPLTVEQWKAMQPS